MNLFWLTKDRIIDMNRSGCNNRHQSERDKIGKKSHRSTGIQASPLFQSIQANKKSILGGRWIMGKVKVWLYCIWVGKWNRNRSDLERQNIFDEFQKWKYNVLMHLSLKYISNDFRHPVTSVRYRSGSGDMTDDKRLWQETSMGTSESAKQGGDSLNI